MGPLRAGAHRSTSVSWPRPKCGWPPRSSQGRRMPRSRARSRSQRHQSSPRSRMSVGGWASHPVL